MSVIPTACSCLINRSISGSFFTSRSPFGVSVLIGTIRIPNPAAKITAFFGLFFLKSAFALLVRLNLASTSSSSRSRFNSRFTRPSE